MKALVVQAHPSSESLTGALAEAAERGLRRSGHAVEVADLTADGFRAAMTAEERTAYHGDVPVIDPLVRRYADAVKASDALVFVYPTWWSGPPAVLKGWFDRVLVPGVAFELDDRGRVRGRLRHVRRLAGVTTYGSPRLAVAATVDGGRRTITRALRLSCGVRCRTSWLGLHDITRRDDDEIRSFIRRVEDQLAAW